MTDLSNLSPVVREAVEYLDASIVPMVSYAKAREALDTIRAELLRLSAVRKEALTDEAIRNNATTVYEHAASVCTTIATQYREHREFAKGASMCAASIRGLKPKVAPVSGPALMDKQP